MKKYLFYGLLFVILTLAAAGPAWARADAQGTIPTVPTVPTVPPRGRIVIPNMWLLTRGEPGDWAPCLLLSPLYPSPERQNALCFNDPDWVGFYDPGWVADASPCHGPVYENDVWVCDGPLGRWNGIRKSLPELMQVYAEHAASLPVDLWKYYRH
jgi:hypothetical protein